MGSKHLLLVALLAATFTATVESTHVKRLENGGLEIDMDLTDLKELPEKLYGHPSKYHKERRNLEGIELGRTYEYQEGTDASLLNKLIAFFLPHINNIFQGLIPDPLAAPVQGRLNLPEVNLFGYCSANAGFDVNFGTLKGLSGVNIDRFQVITGSEKVTPGWSITNGCFETFWSAIIDVGITGLQALTVDDMSAGIHGQACSYEFDEKVTGGIKTEQAQIRAAVKLDGVLLGTLARINFVDIVHDVEVGYESITGSINEAPPALNAMIGNVTRSLSVLARDELLTFLMQDQMDHTVAPSLNARIAQGIQDQEINLSFGQALEIGKGFVTNGARRQIDNFANGAADFLESIGLDWPGEDAAQEEGDNAIAGPEDSNPSLFDNIYGQAEKAWVQAAQIMSGLGFGIGPEEKQGEEVDQGIAPEDQSYGIVPQSVVEEFVDMFKDAQRTVFGAAGNALNAIGVDVNPNQDGDQGIAGQADGPPSDVITAETIQQVGEDVVEQVANAANGARLEVTEEQQVQGEQEKSEVYGIFPHVWDSFMGLVSGTGGLRRQLRG